MPTTARLARPLVAAIAPALLLIACAGTADPVDGAPEPVEAQPVLAADPGVGPMPESWVTPRVADAQNRLRSSDAGKLVLRAIEAHGGLATWLRHGTVEFEFDYAPVGAPEKRRHTFQRLDLWRSRGRHEEVGDGADAELGFDGEQAWITPAPDAFPSTARFWTMTPYYFVGMPFVLGDPGARFEQLPDELLDGEPHHMVKVTYEGGTGDSPDDYYILYLDPDDGRLAALRYIVAYPGFFEPGTSSPEKLMVYGAPQTVGGLRIAHELHTYRWDAERRTRGDKATEVTVSRVRFGRTYPEDLFAPPDGAHIEPPVGARP